jgi:hypothetical protein
MKKKYIGAIIVFIITYVLFSLEAGESEISANKTAHMMPITDLLGVQSGFCSASYHQSFLGDASHQLYRESRVQLFSIHTEKFACCIYRLCVYQGW